MKGPNSTIRYATKQDYLKRRPAPESQAVKDIGDKIPKVKAEAQKGVSEIKDKVEQKVKETGSAGKHLLSQAGSSLAKGLTSMVMPSVPSVGVEVDVAASEKSSEVKATSRKLNDTPGIIFVRGFSLNPFEDIKAGLGEMSGNIPHSEVYKWDNKEEIIEAVKSRPHGQPIILVGHGMGGDTVVDVANELNRVDHGFRTVDLLVTLDSIGMDNDIIPQNVKENFNLISDQDNFFNDGPNVARKKEMTLVTNELRAENHNQLETEPEVQFLVYEKINQTLMRAVAKKNFANQLDQAFRQRMMGSHQLSLNPSSSRFQILLS